MSNADLGKRTLSALNWSYGGAVLRIFSQLLVQLLLARLLGPEAFGQATAAFFVLALGWLLAEGGFGAALVQKAEVTDDDVGYALGWVLLLSCSIGVLVIAASPWLATWLGGATLAPLIVASGALIPMQAVSNIPTSLLRRNLDMRRSQLIFLGGYLVAYAGVGLTLAWVGAGAWSLVVAFGVHSLIGFAGSYAVVRHTLRPRLRGNAALRRFGLQVTGTNAANWAIDNVDRLIVNRFWGTTALGEYTAAYTLSRAPATLLVSSVQSVLFASASRLQAEPERLARGFLAVLGFISLLSFPLFTYLALHAELVVHLLYGQRWQNAAPLFAAFCAALPFFAILAVTGPVLWSVGAVASELKIQLFTGACVLTGFWTLSGFALASVVWLVPAIYAMRVLLVYLALAARLQLHALHTLRTLGAGLLCAGIVVVVFLAMAHVFAESLGAAAAGATLTLLASLLALRMLGSWVIPPELAAILRNRSTDSRPARSLCRLLGIE